MTNRQIGIRGIDISKPAVTEARKKGRNYVSLADEYYFLTNVERLFDVSFTCSVLDHIEYDPTLNLIITGLKRMSRKAVILLETQRHTPDSYYYYHDYEEYGFTKRLDWQYYSEEDNSRYYMFRWMV